MLRKYLAWLRDLAKSASARSAGVQPVVIDACWLEDRLLYSATALPVDMIDPDAAGLGYEVTQAEVDAIMDAINE